MYRAPTCLLLASLFAGCVAVSEGIAEQEQDAPAPAPAAEEVAAGDGLFPIRADGRWGYIDREGAVVIAPRFEEAAAFAEGRARVRERGLWGYLRPDGSFAAEPQFLAAADFAGGRARVVPTFAPVDLVSDQARAADRRYSAFVGPAGQIVTEDWLAEAGDFAASGEGLLAPVAVGRRVGLFLFGLRFLRLATLQTERRWAFLTPDGEVALTVPEADALRGFGAGLAPFRSASRVGGVEGTRWGYLRPDGAVAIGPRFQRADPFSEGLAAVVEGGLYGFIEPSGAYAIPPRFEVAGPFSEGLARVQVEGRWGYVRPDGTLAVAPEYDSAADLSGGLGLVSRGGRFGFVRPGGALALPLRYAFARPFRSGLAYVRETAEAGGREGYVTPDGRFTWTAGSP